ncbi:MAG TPA: hypothetical protein VNV43_09050 [Candidatus Acidoferrales bacterium]|jgi:hypothetical protein|nr:hypothetical protein [Candidatus Acidoferrales bacterium]
MIHKGHAALIAAIITAIIAIIFWRFPHVYYHGVFHWLYVPSVIIALLSHYLVTGNAHWTPNWVGNSAFAVYTIFYLLIFLIVYAIVLEIYILHGVVDRLEDAKKELDPDKPDSKAVLEKIGQAIAEAETRRRKHFLLRPNNAIDLSEAPHLLAARALTQGKQPRPIKRLFRRFRSVLAVTMIPAQSSLKVSKLKEDAQALLAAR